MTVSARHDGSRTRSRCSSLGTFTKKRQSAVAEREGEDGGGGGQTVAERSGGTVTDKLGKSDQKPKFSESIFRASKNE